MAEHQPIVFVVDDDPSARRGLKRLFRAAGWNVETFDSAAAFLAADRADKPGCLVLDVRMPGMTGPQLQEALGAMSCGLPIVFLSAHGDVRTTATAMKRGAVDFLTKPVDAKDLVAAIRESLERDAKERARRATTTAFTKQLRQLTQREREVMTFVIAGLLNKQIAAELGISEETVKVHRGRVMDKLGVASVAELVRQCAAVGITPAGPGKPPRSAPAGTGLRCSRPR
ncbi:MAG TPA: response regulator [Verrucomicrobiota bacterium]|nr:response regulator [Verrucomicrobiota bacterium]HNU50706.1 response regulator [Verrucomicrobiota bacterium]